MHDLTAVLNGDVKDSQQLPVGLLKMLMQDVRAVAMGQQRFLKYDQEGWSGSENWRMPIQSHGDPVFRGDAFQIECYLADALKFTICMRLLGICYTLLHPEEGWQKPITIRLSLGIGEEPLSQGGYQAKFLLSGQGLEKKSAVAMQIFADAPAAGELGLTATLLDTILDKLSPRQGYNLLSVLELGSLSSAAQWQHIAVSTVSRSIAKPYTAVKQSIERFYMLQQQGLLP